MCGLQIRKQLGDMNGQQRVAGFQFHDQTAPDEEIQSCLPDLVVFVAQRDRNLLNVLNTAQSELDALGFLIHGLQEAGPQRSVHL